MSFLGGKSKEERKEKKIPQLWDGEDIFVRSEMQCYSSVDILHSVLFKPIVVFIVFE